MLIEFATVIIATEAALTGWLPPGSLHTIAATASNQGIARPSWGGSAPARLPRKWGTAKMSLAYNDGRALAPSGAPQLPTLLRGYATRPPWSVAGVDYAVGVPSGAVLMNPATISMPGVTVDAAHHIVYVTGSNITLNGYDFSLNGGWGVWIKSGANNTTIEDSNFKIGSSNNLPIRADSGAGSLTVQYNVIDGGGGQNGAMWALINYNGSGAFVAKYNMFRNAPEDAIDFNNGHLTATVEYNVFDNLGTTSGSHPDPVQWVGVTSVNSVEAFNTIYQPNPSGMQGVQLQAQSGETLTNTAIENNVLVAKAPGISMSYSIAVIQNPGNTINGAVVADNYIDYSGAYGPFYPPSGSNLTFANNVNLVTGNQIASPPGTASGGAHPVTPGPQIVPHSALTPENHAVTIPVLSGASDPGGTLNPASVAITAAPLHGRVGVNAATGVVTYTPSSGFYGTDVFDYTVADNRGLISAPAPVTVTVDAPPTATADEASTPENTPVTVAVLANDIDIDGTLNPASVKVTMAAHHGSTAINPATGVITYTPATGYVGADTFAYTVADKAGIVSAPATVGVSVTQPPRTPSQTGYADGAVGASAGAPQLPNLLTSYAQRPAWKVAGVDYAVGVPSGMTLKDPTVAANLPAGTYIDAANHVIHVNGNNVTLSGFNFGLHGGWGVTLDAGASGTTTITNSNFSMGAGQPIAIDSRSSNVGNLVVKYDTFNGNQANIPSTRPPPAGTGLGAAINYDGSGTFVAEYNHLYNLPADGIDFSNGTVTPTIKYNLFGGIGYTPGAHPDPVQFYGGNVNNAVIAFNTIYTPQGSNKAANEGLAIESQGGAKITDTSMENNVIIATGPTMTQSLNIGVFQDPGNTTSGVVVANNYLDPTASWGAFGSGPSAPQGSNLIFSNNVNLLTGKVIASPAGTGTSDVIGAAASPASGVQRPGATITLTLNMDQPEFVTGAPSLMLNDGGIASYAGGSGTNKLTFAYKVGSNDHSVPTLAITGVNLTNGATVKDQFGNAANLGGALVNLSGLGITASASAPNAAPAFIHASDILTSAQAGQSHGAVPGQPDLGDVLRTAGASAADMAPGPAIQSGASVFPNPVGAAQGAAFLLQTANGVPLGGFDTGGSGLVGA